MFSEPKQTASAAPDQTPPGARGGEPPLQVKKNLNDKIINEHLSSASSRDEP